ncbi:hypothetical protein V8E53_000509 [Lactarius tabidus]
MDSPYQLQHYNAHTDRVTVVGSSSSILLQPNSSLLPSIIGSDTESRALLSSSRASQYERFGSVSPYSESISSSPLSFYTANTSPSCSPALLWHSVKPELYAWSFGSTSHQEGLIRTSPFSTSSSPLSFMTANTSMSFLSARQAATSPTSMSSRVSSPYSVTSVNSYKSRKTVLYRRRAHPIPALVSRPATPEYVVSLEVLTWEVRFLCTSLLPDMETRLEPAGMLLLESLDLQDVTDPTSSRAKDEFRYCSEVFIVLTREVILKDAVGARELKGPCKLLLEAFGDILSKSKSFFSSNLNAMGLQSLSVAVELIRFTSVLRALCDVMDAFEVLYSTFGFLRSSYPDVMQAVLDAIRPPSVDGRDIREHGRQVLHKISISAGLTMDQYRKELSQKLSQTQAQLESFPKQFGLSD